MAKRRTTSKAASPSPSTNAPSATSASRLDFERRYDAGDYAGARRAAKAALGGAPDVDVKQRAELLLQTMKAEPGALAVLAGMLVVLVIVFFVLIKWRNESLQTAPSTFEMTKSLVRPPDSAPAGPTGAPAGGETHGTP